MFLWMMLQILIESVPVSSSGHTLLMHMIHAKWGYVLSEQQEIIDFLLHGPSLIIMFCYFFTTWWQMVVGKKFQVRQFANLKTYELMIRPIIFLVLADLVTVIVWYSQITQLKDVAPFILAAGFGVTGIMLYCTKFFTGHKKITFNVAHSIILGLAQGFALLPGVSRFATTFFVGRWLGYASFDAFALSFLIQCPLVVAAFLKGIIVVSGSPLLLHSFLDFWMMFGIVGMSFVSYQLLCFVGSLIQHNRLWYFSWYMLLPIMITMLL